MPDNRYENTVVFWKNLAELWEAEHKATLKELLRLSKKMDKEERMYGKVQFDSIRRLEDIGRACDPPTKNPIKYNQGEI